MRSCTALSGALAGRRKDLEDDIHVAAVRAEGEASGLGVVRGAVEDRIERAVLVARVHAYV